jgi:hypothetical protein
MTTDQPEKRRRLVRFSLRWLLLGFIPLSAGLAICGHLVHQRMRARTAFQAISSKGVDAYFGAAGEFVIYFKNRNVTDEDLEAFTPVFNGYHEWIGTRRITALRLNGSNVSVTALQRFQRAVPDCDVYP